MFSFVSEEDVSLKKGSAVPVPVPTSSSDNITGGYDCNICLDSAHDPVVTLCGHLYCWPCIYKWLQVDSSTPGSEEKCKCPVCKAHISNSSLVPLYGRGTSSTESESKKSQRDVVVPRRPQAIEISTLVNSLSPSSHVSQQLHHRRSVPSAFGSYAALAPSSFGGTPTISLSSPTVGVFGEMFLGRMFGNSDTSLFAYPHPNTSTIPGSGGFRMRQINAQNWLNGRATFYGVNQDPSTFGGACGYDNPYHAGFGVNTAALSSALFRNGQACGACYTVRCNRQLDRKWCLPHGAVTVTATNFCPPNNHGGWCDAPRQHFDMSMPAFLRIARQGNEGVVPILYTRVACKRSGGVRFTLKGQSNFNMVMISNVGGSGDIKSVSIRGSRTKTWLPMYRNWGVNWQSRNDLRSQTLSFRVTLVDGKTMEFINVVPSAWKFGQTFASRRQFN
uniref:Alpha-expansin 12 n=1 Tax=Solanum tuberosum TaxID=4113 RepID=M1AX89_SOLTU